MQENALVPLATRESVVLLCPVALGSRLDPHYEDVPFSGLVCGGLRNRLAYYFVVLCRKL